MPRPVAGIAFSLLCATAVGADAPTDALGDPLPPGAVARLGSNRLYHGKSIERVAATADGRRIVSYGADTGYRVWDGVTGREQTVAGSPPGGKPVPRTMHVAPAGNRVVVVVPDAERPLTRVLDADTGAVVATVPVNLVPVLDRPPTQQHREPVVSPDGRWLTWTETDQRLKLFAVDLLARDPAPVVWYAAPADRFLPMFRYSFSADSQSFLLGFQDATEVWAVGGAAPRLTVPPPRPGLTSAALSGDGGRLVLVHPGATSARVWDVAAGTDAAGPECVGKHPVLSTAVSPDGRLWCVNEIGEPFRVWNLTTGRLLWETRALFPLSVTFTADGKRLIAANGAAVDVWDTASGKPVHDFADFAGFVDALTFTPDGRRVVTSPGYPAGRATRVWNPRTGRKLADLAGRAGWITGPVVSADGRRIATVENDAVRVWDAATAAEFRRIAPSGMKDLAVAFTPDGKQLVVTGRPPLVRCYDLESGEAVREFEVLPTPAVGRPVGDRILGLTFAPGGADLHLHRQGEDRTRVVDWATGAEVRAAPWGVRSAVSPDGRLWAVGIGPGSVRIHDAKTFRLIRTAYIDPVGTDTPAEANVVYSVRFSPCGRLLAAACLDGTVRVWEVATCRERFRFDGHQAPVLAVAFAPDGRLLASGGMDLTGLVWDVAVPVPGTNSLVPTDPTGAWDLLADRDARAGFAAVRYFAAGPADRFAVLAARVKPARAPAAGEVRKLVERLDGPRYADREAATRELAAVAPAVEAEVRAAGEGLSPEGRRRLDDVLAGLDPTHLSGEDLRATRAVEAAERLGTPEARRFLADLAAGAAGAAGAGLTRDAKAALGRLP